ncbi:unnamed protein product [Ostreobium quekettii]|uniref:Uncharacterized protein n=1 Tax=Ostreobium quekettii TaxID=121088 RepID=A0A8S1IVW4_9CHLO|nr:unnamed protein product [Ostreobium quekettii]|eukprot:evm.model.scf_378EXC.3 EVM.evm.TU.scf_378EXC.3   scf_378EXC:69354-74745(+)
MLVVPRAGRAGPAGKGKVGRLPRIGQPAVDGATERALSTELIFHVEIDAWDRMKGGQPKGPQGEAAPTAFLQVLRQWDSAANDFCIQVLKDVQEVKSNLAFGASNWSPRAVGDALAAMGYKVCLRIAVGGRDNTLFQELHHEFLVVCLEGSDEGEEDAEVVVELNLRDQFRVLNPTLRYSQIVDAIPEEYVGPAHKLSDLVELLCQEMASSFRCMGTTLPPWRRHQSMISRWRPKVYRDVRLDSRVFRTVEVEHESTVNDGPTSKDGDGAQESSKA